MGITFTAFTQLKKVLKSILYFYLTYFIIPKNYYLNYFRSVNYLC